MQEIVELVARVADLERRFSGAMKHGTVAEVDPEKGLVRMKLGTATSGGDFLGPWVPYGQIAGALKVHTPPSVGQQMTMMSPTGDMRQSVALPMTWSNQNASPSKAGNEHHLTFGSVHITVSGDAVHVETGAEVIVKSPDVLVEADNVSLGGREGQKVARVGDRVDVKIGSSKGLWPIVEGSDITNST